LEYVPVAQFRVNLKSVDSAAPQKYTWFGDYFYVRPTPVAIADMDLDYACYHASDADTITFDDEYYEAIANRLIWHVAKSLNMYDIAKLHNDMFKEELVDLSKNLQRLLPAVIDPKG